MPPPSCTGPAPRIFVYDGIPRTLLPKPVGWRLLNDVGVWMRNSPHYEPLGECADYFFVPMHPENMVENRMVGDYNMARLYAYIRERWPFWNQSVEAGTARHFHLLPCDHGPGDCAYDRPLIPNKWSPGESLVQQNRRNNVNAFKYKAGADFIRRAWGSGWEHLNPASPQRLVFYLTYNGWPDQLRSNSGHCRNCFQHGLDIRLPTPEGHECGPFCGVHHRLPIDLKRQILATRATMGPWAAARRERRARGEECKGEGCVLQRGEGPLGNCSFFWAGAVRWNNNPDRRALMRAMHQPGLCVRNTACAELPRSCPEGEGTLPPGNWTLGAAMSAARFCFSPRGWDMGDSDRYLPAVLHGCVPVMSDRMEAMPLQEHPSLEWSKAVLAVETDSLPRLGALLQQVDAEAEAALRSHGEAIWQRLLYTSHYFGATQRAARWGARKCSYHSCCLRCSPSSPSCVAAELQAQRAASGSAPAGRFPSFFNRGAPDNEQTRYLSMLGGELHRMGLALPNGSALPPGAAAAGAAACAEHHSYLGEDGRSDAMHTLMELLRHRLSHRPAPPEPWTCAATPAAGTSYTKPPLRAFPDGTAVVRRAATEAPGCAVPETLDKEWFQRRAAWYKLHGVTSDAQPLRMLPVIRIAAAHRRAPTRAWDDADLEAAARAPDRTPRLPAPVYRAAPSWFQSRQGRAKGAGATEVVGKKAAKRSDGLRG